jgi:hypothetical protein
VAEVRLLVLPDARTRAWPQHTDAPVVRAVSLPDALRGSWATDAHTAAYLAPDPATRLCNTDGAGTPVWALGVVPRMVLLVVDVDHAPTHEGNTARKAEKLPGLSAPEEWRVAERAKVDALRAVHPGVVMYETRGGYRLVAQLPNPVPIDSEAAKASWRRWYVSQLGYLSRAYAIEGDPACSDWTRLYRLPHATRGGGVPEALPVTGTLGVWVRDGGDGDGDDAAELRRLGETAKGWAAPARLLAPPPPRLPLTSGSLHLVSHGSRETDRARARYDKALRDDCAALAAAPVGTRNTVLSTTALRMGRLALDAGLPVDAPRDELAAAAEDAGLTSAETRATLDSAFAHAERVGPAPPPVDRPRPEPLVRGRGAREPTPPTPATTTAGRIELGHDVARIEDEVIAALSRHPDLYQRHPFGLCRVLEAPPPASHTTRKTTDAALPENLSAPLLRSWISTIATLVSWDARAKAWRPVAPPEWLPSGVLARKAYSGIRRLRGVIEAPMMRPDGTVLSAPGYDDATGLLLLWPGAPLEVPEHPTHDDAREAFGVLATLFAEFTMQGDASTRGPMIAACVAAILTPLARHAIDGGVPTFLWEADGPGSGKTLAATVCGGVVLGRAPAVRPYTPDDDEMRKVLGALALASPPLALFDNIRDHIQGGALEQVITTPDSFAPRILGVSSAPELPWRVVLYLTANGVTLSGDLAQRALCVRLTRAPGANDREYNEPELLRAALTRRPTLLRAALTLLRAHVVAGRPKAGQTHDRFPEWSRAVSHAITWASGLDPTLARPRQEAVLDATLGAVLAHAWHEALRAEPVTLSALRDRLARADRNSPGANGPAKAAALCELRSALADCMGVADLARVSNVAIGRRLKSFIGKAYPVEGGASLVLQTRTNRANTVEYSAHQGSATE